MTFVLSIAPSSFVAVSTTSWSELSACRASPAEVAAMKSSASSLTSMPYLRTDGSLTARRRMVMTCSRSSAGMTTTFVRDRSAEFTSNDGFSVVAPMRMMSPASTKREKGVLLRFVEAVDLVDEDDRLRPARFPLAARLLHQRPDLFDRGAGGGKGHELRAGLVGDDARQRRLAGAGRAPEDHRRDAVALDGGAEKASLAEELIEADDVLDRAGAEPLGQRGVAGWRGVERVVGEEGAGSSVEAPKVEVERRRMSVGCAVGEGRAPNFEILQHLNINL